MEQFPAQRTGICQPKNSPQSQQGKNHVGQVKSAQKIVPEIADSKGADQRRGSPGSLILQSQAPGSIDITDYQQRSSHHFPYHLGRKPVSGENHQSQSIEYLHTEYSYLGGIPPVGAQQSAFPVEKVCQHHFSRHVTVNAKPAKFPQNPHGDTVPQNQPDPGEPAPKSISFSGTRVKKFSHSLPHFPSSYPSCPAQSLRNRSRV